MNEDTKINGKSGPDLFNESMIVQPDAPWYQVSGEITSDEYLKKLTPSWDMETWEKYLPWIERHEPRTNEALVHPKRYDELCNEMEESIFVNAESGADNSLRTLVAEYLIRLTPKQRRVLEMIFWEGRSERYVASVLSINYKSVHRLKLRAFNKIKQLTAGGPRLPYMRGLNFLIEDGEANQVAPSVASGILPEAG